MSNRSWNDPVTVSAIIIKKPRFCQKRGFCLHAKDTDTKLSPPAARYRSGKSRQAKGSRGRFRHGKHHFIIELDVINVY